jgi:hypothetical protein
MKVKVKRQGQTTTVTVIDAQRNITAQGTTTCAEGDVYSPVVGEYIALHRALMAFGTKLYRTGNMETLSKKDYDLAMRFVGRDGLQ